MKTPFKTIGISALALALLTGVWFLAMWRRAGELHLAACALSWVIVWLIVLLIATIAEEKRVHFGGAFHRLRPCEMTGGIHERLGVRLFKWFVVNTFFGEINKRLKIRGGPKADLPRLSDEFMRAEANHVLCFLLTLPVTAAFSLAGPKFILWLSVFNFFVNICTAVLQRYNRNRARILLDSLGGEN